MRLRYFLRVTVMRNYSGKLVHEETFRVQVAHRPRPRDPGPSPTQPPPLPTPPMVTPVDDAAAAAAVWQVASEPPENNPPIKMEVGIEDCLHIEFEYNHSRYHLRDVVHGKIFFLLVRIKIKNMEVAIIRRESTGTGANVFNESETVAKFEIMDGAPVRGESIPIRLFLSGFENLTPTFKNVNNKFSVKYFLNLVLVDEEDRRYFKQQEVQLWRKA